MDFKSQATRAATDAMGRIISDIVVDAYHTVTTPQSKRLISNAVTQDVPNGKIRVCIFRRSTWARHDQEVPVYFDEIPLARICGGAYLVVWVSPGQHALMSERESVVKLNFQFGQEYYIELSVGAWNEKGHVTLSNLEAWRGVRAKLKPVVANKIHM